MAKSTPAEMTTEALEAKLRAVRSIHITITVIFGVIIATWLLLGLWRENLPVFTSTVAMGVAISALQLSIRKRLLLELERRRSTAAGRAE